VIPTIIAQLLGGETVALGNLEPTRDFTFVTDTVDAFVRIGETPSAVGRVFNVGSGMEVSIGALAKRIEAALGRHVQVQHDESRVRPAGSEVGRLCADAAVARRVLGWEPQTTLDDGLAATAAWIAENLEQYRVGAYAR
jgi:nucleoside-diphosphate-sugar epimerase